MLRDKNVNSGYTPGGGNWIGSKNILCDLTRVSIAVSNT